MSGRVVTIGEGLAVLRASEIGSLAQLPQLLIGTGGAEGNVAIGLARLGVSVTWLGRVGDDSLGRRVARELRAEAVDVIAIVDRAAPTGLLLKETPTPGSTVITYYRSGSAGSRLQPTDLEALPLESGDILHLTGITPALSSSARACVFAAIDRAEAVGAMISYDVNHRSRLWSWSEAAPVHREIAARAQVLFASDDEARLLIGDGDDLDPRGDDDLSALAARLSALGPTEVVITRGPAGALVLSPSGIMEQPAVPLPIVVDTVGAGDAFVAGYLAELINGAPVAQRVLTAVRTGAAACLHPGDWEGAATRDMVEAAADCPTADPVRR